MAPKVTFCSTPASITLAVSALSSQPVILVDCEAHDLGRLGGALSIISLSNSLAEHAFLIDVLAFPSSQPGHASPTTPPSTPLPHPALAPLLDLLSLPRITKVFWDGCADALKLLLMYGIVLANVLNLQLVDVALRVHSCATGQPAPDLLRGYFRLMHAELQHHPGMYTDIYMLMPMGNNNQGTKDSTVVTMHGSAVHDLMLIVLMYAHSTHQAWVRTCMPTLQAQPAVYVGILDLREKNKCQARLNIMRFMPLGIINGGGDNDNALQYKCGCCRRELAANCYATRLQIVEGGERKGIGHSQQAEKQQRLLFCQLCNVVARRNGRAQGKWAAG